MASAEKTTENTELRYAVDSSICAGHGRCYALAPKDFDADDIGYGQALDQVHPASDRKVMEGIAIACPEEAISIVPAHQ
ncbi:ferredoxin [Nocardia alni]|uniref:ferredoxin n=1 Tax=Nocardia alni TaxID=2815723 RepID=UPI0020B1CC77|nr:ferredoxin [Nocardia alni]